MRRVGYALSFLALTTMSVVALIRGEPLLGSFGILLFGVGGVAYFLLTAGPLGSGSSKPRPRRTVVRSGRLAGMRKFTAERVGLVFPGSRWGLVLTLLAAAVFVIAGLLAIGLAFDPPDTTRGYRRIRPAEFFVAGLALVVFFSGVAVVALRSLIAGGGGIALVADGVYFRAPAGRAWVRWEHLASVGLGDGIRFLAFSPELITLTGINRWLHRINRNKHRMDVGYPIVSLKSDHPGTVVEWINHYHAHPEARAELRDPRTAGHRSR